MRAEGPSNSTSNSALIFNELRHRARETPARKSRRLPFFGALLAGLAIAGTAAASPNAQSTAEWRLLGNGSDVQHYSPLNKVNLRNVKQLGLAWSADIPALDGLVGNPLVAEGVVYQSGGLGRVYANDLRTGEPVWRFEGRKLDPSTALAGYWSALYNRGLALDGDRVFVASGDCYLIALDRKTGKKLWETQSCDARELYGITAAPRVGGGLVFTGNNCIDSGATRGFVDAFDQATGKRRWRFWTVPGDPKKGFENELMKKVAATWGTNWYEKSHGCGSVWDAMTYDEKSGLLFIGVGGPAPWSPGMRAADAGDELFTNSIVALKAATGEYVWHFKQTPQDAWNFDATAHMMLADLPTDGKSRRVLMQAPKNGFFYVLDAATGQFISAKPFSPVTWARSVDPKTGRPVVRPEAQYWKSADSAGSVVSPGALGARNWQAMAFEPKRRLVFFGAYETPTRIVPDPKAAVGGMLFDMYYGLRGDPQWKTAGYLIAWDPVSQSKRWQVNQALPLNGGALATGGDLVFQGQADGHFNAYSADTGKLVWSYRTGASIMGAPTTVEVDGEQYILAPSGNNGSAAVGVYLAKLASTPMTRAPSRLLAFKLGGTELLPKTEPKLVPQPQVKRINAELEKKGRVLFEQHFCADCHGLDAESAAGKIKDLRMATAETHGLFPGIVLGGLRKDKGMPAFPQITIEELQAIQAYVIGEAWDAYDAQQSDRKPPALKSMR